MISEQSFQNVECCKCSKIFLNQRSNIPIVLQHCNLSIMPWNIQYSFLGIRKKKLIPRKKYWIFQGIIERLQCCKTIGTFATFHISEALSQNEWYVKNQIQKIQRRAEGFPLLQALISYNWAQYRFKEKINFYP